LNFESGRNTSGENALFETAVQKLMEIQWIHLMVIFIGRTGSDLSVLANSPFLHISVPTSINHLVGKGIIFFIVLFRCPAALSISVAGLLLNYF